MLATEILRRLNADQFNPQRVEGAKVDIEAAKETVLEIMPVEVLQQFAVDAPDDPGVSNP